MVTFHINRTIMTRNEKKAKAAAVAVACYMKLNNEKCVDHNCNNWSRVNRALTLKRGDLLRINGRIPSSYRLRM